MSGGVGPTCDIALPKAPLQEPQIPDARRRSLFTFRQLNALAVVIVLSASGLVSSEEVGFVFFSAFYIYFMSRVAFPARAGEAEAPFSGGIQSVYAVAGAVIGLFLPIAYILQGIVEGDTEGIKAAAPHVFLLAGQIFMEGVSLWWEYSVPIRVIVSVLYNAMRIMSILEWVKCEISMSKEGRVSGQRLYVGKALAFANMAFWSFNLFGFLLPFYLPKAFKMYYTKLKD